MIIALLLVVALLLGGTFAFTSWRINRLAARRWTTLQRHLDGAIAGVGIFVAAPLGALFLVVFLSGPVSALARRLGWLAPPAWQGEVDPVVALAVALPGALGVSAWIGASCVRPRRRGVLCGVGVLAFAAVTGAATWFSPLSEVTPALRWVSVMLASSAACVLGGAGLLASERPEE